MTAFIAIIALAALFGSLTLVVLRVVLTIFDTFRTE